MKKRKNLGRVIGMGERCFDVGMTIFGILLSIVVFYPIYYVIIASFSKPLFVENGSVLFSVKGFTLESYRQAVAKKGVWTAYANTIYYTIIGVTVNMVFSTSMAYALSKSKLVFRKFFTLLAIFTMWFNAGIIPTYMNFKDLGLLDTRTAIIFGFAINTYNMIIMKSFFEQLPYELEEAAWIDGANHFTIFLKIFLPLSKPALATVGMFYGVSRWNSYFWAMQLLNDDNKVPLQVLLKKMLVDRTSNAADAAIITKASLSSPTTVIYAMIVLAIIPIVIVFPFVQKYFKTGLTVGGVKG